MSLEGKTKKYELVKQRAMKIKEFLSQEIYEKVWTYYPSKCKIHYISTVPLNYQMNGGALSLDTGD